MVNYFNSISLYRWKMTDDQVSKLEEILPKLNWKVLLGIQIVMVLLLATFTFISLVALSEVGMDLGIFISSVISDLVLGILFLFGGYYFTILFFKTELTVTQFYTVLMYLYLPILTFFVGITMISALFATVLPELLTFSLILYLMLIYYALKELNTSIYIFKKEFNTTDFPLVGVVILWSILTGFVSNLLNYGLGLLF